MNIEKQLYKPTTRWFTCLLVAGAFSSVRTVAAQTQPALAPSTIRLSPEDQERGQHGVQQNFFFLPPGKTGENYQSAGFFGQKLRPYISSSPEAIGELNSYRRQKTLYLIDKGLLVGSLAVYGSQVFAHGEPVYTTGTQQVAAGVALFSVLATIFINHHTNEYLKQAVDNYNSSLSAQQHGALWLRLRPAGVALASTPQGQPLLGLHWQL